MDWVDPAFVFDAVEAAGGDVFWLDTGRDAVHGWSVVGEGQTATIPGSIPVGARSGTGDRARELADSSLPGPFRGGWVGWFSYDAAAGRAGAPGAEAEAAGDRAVRATRWFAFDHARRRAWVVAATEPEAERWRGEILTQRTVRGASTVAGHADVDARATANASTSVARARHAPDEYAALIAECREAIRRGDAYQLCLTTRFDVARSTQSPSAAEVYRRLRVTSPAHHGGFLRVGDTAIASASPEVFLRVEPGEDGPRVTTSPIKGTRPRGATAAADRALIEELRTSEKERAENVMIVDLMRNDLARVCESGSVHVDELLAVESYAHVHQLVSTVSGALRPEITLGELLTRVFPAGSMTGAPKVSAMTILHELEGAPRGVFAGCWGWVGDDGALELAMVIRTIVVTSGNAYVGAGGGITWASIVDEEVREVAIKARAPLAALGAIPPEGWATTAVR